MLLFLRQLVMRTSVQHLPKLATCVLASMSQAQTPYVTQSKGYVPALVVVDQRDPSYTVFMPLAKDTPAEKLQKIKQKVASDDRTALVSWENFVKNATDYGKQTIKVNDYPNIDTVDGLTCLLGKKVAKNGMWGLTWNGGIALMYRDYERARKSYKKYLLDPSSHQAETDPRADPIYPNHHLTFAGCKR